MGTGVLVPPTDSSSDPIAIFVVGAPGTGKSTVAHHLTRKFGYSLFLSGQTLRQIARDAPGSRIGREIGARLEVNQSMPIELYCEIVKDALGGRDHSGLVVDGFPRTVEQCLAIPEVLRSADLSSARIVGIALRAPASLSAARIANRSVCPTCGRELPGSAGCCANGAGVRRADDTPDNTNVRLTTHAHREAAIAEVFARSWDYLEVDATGDVEQVVTRTITALGAVAP
jgi:adenylate kinase family enzyme